MSVCRSNSLSVLLVTPLLTPLTACVVRSCRDAGGYMYYLPSTDADSLVQIDLSDDAIVAQLFANHAWEELLEPLEVVTRKLTHQTCWESDCSLAPSSVVAHSHPSVLCVVPCTSCLAMHVCNLKISVCMCWVTVTDALILFLHTLLASCKLLPLQLLLRRAASSSSSSNQRAVLSSCV